MKDFTTKLKDEDETKAFASALAESSKSPLFITLKGELGAGKTTFARGFLRGFGYNEKVKSPTYTLVESYDVGNLRLHHFDLYRIADVEELELIGIRDYFAEKAIILLEWPENATQILPEADLSCYIVTHGRGRTLTITAHSSCGVDVLTGLRWHE